MRISPDDYFTMQEQNQFREGVKIGAILILVGVVVGALIVYFARKG